MSKVIVFCIVSLFIISCIDKNFVAYSIDGQLLKQNDFQKNSSSISDFKLFFSKDEIDVEYTEIHFIATNYFYYGQFFFDKNFMSMLKNRALNMGVDALIYEKDRTDFPNYNENYLYFTAIKFNN